MAAHRDVIVFNQAEYCVCKFIVILNLYMKVNPLRKFPIRKSDSNPFAQEIPHRLLERTNEPYL